MIASTPHRGASPLHVRRLRGFSGHLRGHRSPSSRRATPRAFGFEVSQAVGRPLHWNRLRGFSGRRERVGFEVSQALVSTLAPRFLRPLSSLLGFGVSQVQATACRHHLTMIVHHLTMVVLLHPVGSHLTGLLSASDRAKCARHVEPARIRRAPWRRPMLAISMEGAGHGRSTRRTRIA